MVRLAGLNGCGGAVGWRVSVPVFLDTKRRLFSLPTLSSGLCVPQAGFFSGIVELECLRTKNW